MKKFIKPGLMAAALIAVLVLASGCLPRPRH